MHACMHTYINAYIRVKSASVTLGGCWRFLAVTAWRLCFTHPFTGERLRLEDPAPADMAGFFVGLANSPCQSEAELGHLLAAVPHPIAPAGGAHAAGGRAAPPPHFDGVRRRTGSIGGE